MAQNLTSKLERFSVDDLQKMIKEMKQATFDLSRVLTVVDMQNHGFSVVIRPLGISILVAAS